jgi:hypothetical protein
LLIEQTRQSVLFHYTNAIALHNILDEELLWVTRSDFLNDYLESNYINLILEETISRVIVDFPSTELFFQLLRKDRTIKKQLKFKHYILLLSENWDSLALWSNYSNHDGYNIGFKVAELIMTEAHKGQIEEIDENLKNSLLSVLASLKYKVLFNAEQKEFKIRRIARLEDRKTMRIIQAYMNDAGRVSTLRAPG